jgi:hypothetical protein
VIITRAAVLVAPVDTSIAGQSKANKVASPERSDRPVVSVQSHVILQRRTTALLRSVWLLKLRSAGHDARLMRLHGLLNLGEDLSLIGGNIAFLRGVTAEVEK